ncbi:helix-turn-helix domain-containing protein [Paraburkholderia caballeronis]|uniref:helix-turn-helix domain-containing protein n=1 Tax=Paraburkholderia caballeronis TaxID=416943 RepID=UPI001FBBE55F|nr:helix-turn-helix domain-containing protein [Paraburkholderia caballeronis]
MSEAELSEIMTLPQVALYLKVTERTIYRLAAAKEIPAFKVGGSWRFSLSDIEHWIKEQSQSSLERLDK